MTAETMPAVTDADREAGAQIAALQELREMILAGEADDSSPVHIAVKIRREALEAGKLEGARLMQEAAARVADKRADDRFADFGTTEPDTNASYYSGRHGETLDELDEEDWHIRDTIRALDPITVLRNAAGCDA